MTDPTPSDLLAGLSRWQATVAAITEARYPTRCSPDARVAKLTEEIGELAGEVVRLQEQRGDMHKTAAEFGDALVCLVALGASVGIDVGEAAARRWAVLLDRPADGFRTPAEDEAPLADPDVDTSEITWRCRACDMDFEEDDLEQAQPDGRYVCPSCDAPYSIIAIPTGAMAALRQSILANTIGYQPEPLFDDPEPETGPCDCGMAMCPECGDGGVDL